MYRPSTADRDSNNQRKRCRRRSGVRFHPMHHQQQHSHIMTHDHQQRQRHQQMMDQSERHSSQTSMPNQRQVPSEVNHPPAQQAQQSQPQPLSNTQLKKIRVQEWRRNQRENQNRGLPPHPPQSSGHCNNYCPIFDKPSHVSNEITKQVAIDCEMVGAGPRGCRDMLARVSIVNTFGNVVYDKYVQPIHPVTDYRSFVSGIYPHHLQEHAVPFAVVQREVCDLLKDKVLVGHAIKHDLRVLFLQHPTNDIRDTSLYFDASVYGGRGTPSLRKLTEHYIGVSIQSCAHDSVEDARATMRLYCMFKKEWEAKLTAACKQQPQK